MACLQLLHWQSVASSGRTTERTFVQNVELPQRQDARIFMFGLRGGREGEKKGVEL